MSLYIGVDSGTQSVKAVALDLETGRVAAEARYPHKLIEGLPPGHMEQHPQEWATAMDAAIGELASRIDRPRVRGIGVSGQQAVGSSTIRPICRPWVSATSGIPANSRAREAGWVQVPRGGDENRPSPHFRNRSATSDTPTASFGKLTFAPAGARVVSPPE